MIKITKGQANEVFLTVTEKTTLSAPVRYLFEFISDENKTYTYCIASATTNTRGDLFTITEKTSPVVTNAEINLEDGSYTYRVYQQTSTTNLDPNLTTPADFSPFVEQGFCEVKGTATTFSYYDGADAQSVTYE